MANLPDIDRKIKICIVCEGDEDVAYIKRLISLNVWNEIYHFVPLNAKCADNIPATFQNAFQNDQYEIILVFCDTDKYPYKKYKPIKERINAFFNKRKAAEKLVIFANPCTMQIILSHFGDIALRTQSKRSNALIIEQLTGVPNYDAHEKQIDEICNKIFRRTYPEMRERVKCINNYDSITPSTNFIIFLERFESDDIKWITEIQKYLNRN